MSVHGATATSTVVAADVCFQEVAKLFSPADMKTQSRLSVDQTFYVCNGPKRAILHEPRGRFVARMFTFWASKIA